jgi:hypothetical protein
MDVGCHKLPNHGGLEAYRSQNQVTERKVQ